VRKRVIRIKASPVNKLFKRYREFQKMGTTEIEDSYTKSVETLISEKLMKEGFRAPVDRTQWVSNENFKSIFGIATTSRGFSHTPDTYVTRAPSESPLLHKFREHSPSRWLYGSFKF
jgi:hypothetical protein